MANCTGKAVTNLPLNHCLTAFRNVDCDSTMLVQFAIMGSVLAEEVVEIPNPRVALLNIGEEEVKGLDSIRDASAVLKSNIADWPCWMLDNGFGCLFCAVIS